MVSEDDVKKLAQLARLEISNQGITKVATKLSSILGYINQLNEVDVTGVEPMSHVHGVTNVMRPDETKPSLSVEELKKLAPEMNGRFIKVPLVVE